QSWTIARRPFLVGIAHGLAGTGAITALALASMPSAGAAFLYLALFAAGSIAGMALLTGIAGFPIEKLARRPAAHSAVTACVGGASLVVGIVWGVPIAGHLLGSCPIPCDPPTSRPAMRDLATFVPSGLSDAAPRAASH